MGFPYASINIARPPKTIILLVDLLCHIRFMAVLALNHLGLSSPPVGDVYAIVQPSPSTWIKKRLPAVEYSDFLHKIRRQEDEDTVSAVNGFERRHEIRELPNCCHAFHNPHRVCG